MDKNIETTPYGSTLFRSLTSESLGCFESMNVGNEWKYLTSVDNRTHHSVWINPKQRSLLTYCEGDVVEILSPDEFTFSLETQVQLDFTDAQKAG